MLNIYFGYMEEAIYDPSMYFRNQCEDKWITDEISKRNNIHLKSHKSIINGDGIDG